MSDSNEFVTNKVFMSREDLTNWVQTTARSIGYVIVTKRSKANANGFTYKVALKCDRGGKYKSKGTTNKACLSRKINCPFQLEGKYSKEYSFWTLRVICGQHNHPPAKDMQGHPYAMRLSENQYHYVADLTKKNVTPRDILDILKDQDENTVSTLKTIYNARQKLRLAENIGTSPMQVFLSRLNANGYVFEFTINDASNQLEKLFFVHPKSLEIWRAFPHVLIMDATYKTNIYNMPFVEIVGVTSTSKTFCIAFAIVPNEKGFTYKWILECLKSTLDACMKPRVIVTDRDLALMNACQEVFPDAARLVCRQHIRTNVFSHCRPSFRTMHGWQSFLSKWEILINSRTWNSYLENYNQLHSFLINIPRVFNYLENNWLSKYKQMFVSFWIDEHLNFGNTTTNRVESQHANLKRRLGSEKASLLKFLGCIDQIVNTQVTEIKATFERSRIFRNKDHNISCFELLQGVVSLEALNIMSEEVKRIHDLQADLSYCGCKLLKSCGLPCACVLSVYVNTGQCISPDLVDIFWRKLDFSPSTYEQDDDLCCDDDLEKFKQNFDKHSKSGKKNLLKRLRDISDFSQTTIKEPPIQKKSRGRPSAKKQRQNNPTGPKKQDLYSATPKLVKLDVDLNKTPPTDNIHSSSQTGYSHELISQIPKKFHPYITRIVNVRGDGNCGYRSLAVGLGLDENDYFEYIRGLMKEELENKFEIYKNMFQTDIHALYESLCFIGTPCPPKYWMTTPIAGVLIANKLDVIVHVLCEKGSTTIFPFWKGPNECQHQALTIALVNDEKHYVMVKLEREYPMPNITAYHNSRFISSSAAQWKSVYKQRLDLYDQLCEHERVFVDISD